MDFLKKVGKTLAPGINVRNDTEFPILFVFSQLSPLHWDKVEPGETKHFKCGKVWFTASTEFYCEDTVPTAAGVALRIAAITTTTLLTGGFIGIAVAGGVSGMTSSKGAKVDGVYADGKTLVVSSVVTDPTVHQLVITGH